MIYLPDDIWNIIKSFQGFHQYYHKPARTKEGYNQAFFHQLNKRCFDKFFAILSNDIMPSSLSTKLLRALVFFIHHNTWVQVLRLQNRFWDTAAHCIATQCNEYLTLLNCNCGREHCTQCTTHNILDRVSRMFYTVYLQDV